MTARLVPDGTYDAEEMTRRRQMHADCDATRAGMDWPPCGCRVHMIASAAMPTLPDEMTLCQRQRTEIAVETDAPSQVTCADCIGFARA